MLVPIAVLVVAAGLAVAAAFGGLAEAPEPAPPTLGKGGVVDQERISTRFEDAVVRAGGEGVGSSGKRYLQIHLRVTNRSDETVSAFSMIDSTVLNVRADGETIRAPGRPGTPLISVPIAGRPYDQIHPRLTMPVVMAFDLPADRDPPRTVQIDAGTFELVRSFFNDVDEWRVAAESVPQAGGGPDGRLVKKVVATVELPVRTESGS